MANTSKRGFASMDPAKQREIASKGGKAAHAKGTAHEFTSDEARVAGRKGGEAVSRDRAHMSAIGREGGHSRGARARAGSGGINASTGGSESNERPQSFNRQTSDDRNAFSESRAALAGTGASSYGSQERGNDRGFAGTNNNNSRNSSSRENDRSSDTPSDHNRFSGRDEI